MIFRKYYEQPQLKVEYLDREDVLTASTEIGEEWWEEDNDGEFIG